VHRYDFPLGSVLGIPVRVHLGFLVLATLFVVHGQGWSEPAVLTTSLSFVVALFLAILAHELGHGLAARAVGGRAEGLHVDILGGHALVDHPRRTGPRVVVALAGVVVNAVLSALAFGVLRWQGADPGLPVLATGGTFVAQVYSVNASLAIFNLLPGYPLDGGSVLEALLARRFGARPAAGVVLVIGVVLGTAFLLAGAASGAWMFVAVGFSILMACGARYQRLRAKEDEASRPEFASFDPELGVKNDEPEPPRPAPRRRARRTASPANAPAGEEPADGPSPEPPDERRLARERLDRILDRIAVEGMGALSSEDRRFLDDESRRLRARHEQP
jgi:Zn-dependent protease